MAGLLSSDAHLVITGPMGVGKTTLATRLAAALDRPLRDSDGDIERLFGRSGRAIAADRGVDALHDLEAAVLLGALAGTEPQVIAAAGWVVEDECCREALARRATVLVLDLATADLLARLAADADQHRRPIPAAEVEALAQRRRSRYRQVADRWLDASRSPDELVADVLSGTGPDHPTGDR